MDLPSRNTRPPDTVFHGTDCKFDRFDLSLCLGAHFGTSGAATARLRSTGRLAIDYQTYRTPEGQWMVREQNWSNKPAFEHGPFASEEDADCFVLCAPPHRVPLQFEIDVCRPLPLPDLGTWTFEIVMRHLQDEGIFVDTGEIWDAWNISSEHGWAAMKAALSSMYYDCVCYTNETEDPGSISWIVFEPNRIHAKWRPGPGDSDNDPRFERDIDDEPLFQRERMRA